MIKLIKGKLKENPKIQYYEPIALLCALTNLPNKSKHFVSTCGQLMKLAISVVVYLSATIYTVYVRLV